MSNSSVHRSFAIGPAISPDANLISFNIKCCDILRYEEERKNREENRGRERKEEVKRKREGQEEKRDVKW